MIRLSLARLHSCLYNGWYAQLLLLLVLILLVIMLLVRVLLVPVLLVLRPRRS